MSRVAYCTLQKTDKEEELMSFAQKAGPETLTQRQFLAQLTSGRQDFAGVIFTERVNLNQFTANIGSITVESLDFSDCDLGPDFGLGDISVNTLFMERARSRGKVCLFRLTATTLHLKQLAVTEWCSLIHSTIDGCDLTKARFPGGLCIKSSPIQTLILDHVESAQCLIDEERGTISNLSAIDANLGRREPTKLSDLF